MIKDLDNLIALQAIDLRIFEIQRSSEEFPEMVLGLESAIAKAQASLDSTGKKISDFEAEKKALLDRHNDAMEALKKSEDRLNSIKTNREYDAVHAEIENNKHTIATTQSKTDAIDANIAAATTARDEAQTALDAIKAENEPRIAELKAKITTIDSAIAEVRKERDALVPVIGKSALRNYDHILKKRKNGQVLATIGIGKRTCSVCHKVLESQLFNEVRKGDRIQTCQSCGSILVWDGNSPSVEAAVQ